MPSLDQLIQYFAVGCGIYAAIRVDLATLKVRLERAERDIEKLQKDKAP